MTARPSIDVSGWLEEQLAEASPDLLRSMVQTFAEALMSAEADAICRERSDERINSGNGYRSRDFDTRVWTMTTRVPLTARGSGHILSAETLPARNRKLTVSGPELLLYGVAARIGRYESGILTSSTTRRKSRTSTSRSR